MKITVDIPDALLQEAKTVGEARGTSFREIVESGLRLAIRDFRQSTGFKLRDCSFRGTGLAPGHDLEEDA